MSDGYITLVGIAAQTVLYLVGGYALVLKTIWSNDALAEQVKAIQVELKALSTIITTLAVQDERLNNQGDRINQMDKKIEALRRGDGFITGARGVEKEY